MTPKATLQRAVFTICALVIGAACSIEQDQNTASTNRPPVFQQQESCLCGPQVARNVGMLFYRSNPATEMDQNQFDQFRALVEGNSESLQESGPTITCTRQLGEALASVGLRTFSQGDYDDSYASVLSQGGTMEQAQDVAGSMNSGAVDAFMTAFDGAASGS